MKTWNWNFFLLFLNIFFLFPPEIYRKSTFFSLAFFSFYFVFWHLGLTRTSFIAGSAINVTWHLAYAHRVSIFINRNKNNNNCSLRVRLNLECSPLGRAHKTDNGNGEHCGRMHDIESTAWRRFRWFLPIAIIFIAQNATAVILHAEFIVVGTDFVHTRLHHTILFATIDDNARIMNVIAIDWLCIGAGRIGGTIFVNVAVAVQTLSATRWKFDRIACTSFVNTAPWTLLLVIDALNNFTVRC